MKLRPVQGRLDEGKQALEILDNGLMAAMDDVGAPAARAYADETKADGYAADAPGAVALCKSMLV